MTSRTLGSTSLTVSPIGFGCVALAGQYGPLAEEEGIRAVHHAIDSGINFFDTSAYYGETLSETRLGKALEGRRDEVVLATKGGRHATDRFDFSYDNIIQMCEDSLKRLQTDWLDIYQLHDIEFGEMDTVLEGCRALCDLKEQGKARFIGVTGYPPTLLRHMAETRDFDVTLTYCHGNLLNNRMDDVLAPVTKKNGMGLINGSVTHMGVLTPQGEQDWHPAPIEVKQAGREAAKYCADRGVNLAELAIQYSLRNENADVTLLGTRTVEELENSIALLNRPIDEEVLAGVEAILKPVHNVEWASGLTENAVKYG
ncbi:MAG: aldo/keto reductase [Verrucomicrobiales bacterium]|nr:aldo/keto reductase [Verrucomicrobiales bacterium]